MKSKNIKPLKVLLLLTLFSFDSLSDEFDVNTIENPQFKTIKPLNLDNFKTNRWTVNGIRSIDPTKKQINTNSIGITINEARKIALKHQLEIEAELIKPEISKETLNEAKSKFDAIIHGSLQRDELNYDYIPPQTNEANDKASVGITLPLITGGAVTISLPFQTQFFNNDNIPGFPDKIWGTSPKFNLKQPLLKGGWLKVNKASIEKSRLSYEQSKARSKLYIINLLANVDRIYWNLWAVNQEVIARYEQYEFAVKQLEQAQQLVGAGILPQIEILRAEVGVSQRINGIISAETNRKIIERQFKWSVNDPSMKLDSKLTILPNTKAAIFQLTLNTDMLVSNALSKRMDLLNEQLQVSQGIIDEKLNKNQLLPELALIFEYGNISSGSSFNDVFGAIGDNDRASWVTGLQLSYPLGNRAAKSRLKQSALRNKIYFNNIKQKQYRIIQEVYNAVDRLTQNWQLINASRQEIKLSQNIYQGELEQFKINLRTSTEVLNAAQYLTDAKIRNIRAISNFEIAKVELAYATGTQLGYSDLRIPTLE